MEGPIITRPVIGNSLVKIKDPCLNLKVGTRPHKEGNSAVTIGEAEAALDIGIKKEPR